MSVHPERRSEVKVQSGGFWQRKGQGHRKVWSELQPLAGWNWRWLKDIRKDDWGTTGLETGVQGLTATQSRERPPDGERAAGKTQAIASHAPVAESCSSSPGCEMHQQGLGRPPPRRLEGPKPGMQSHILCVLPTTRFPSPVSAFQVFAKVSPSRERGVFPDSPGIRNPYIDHSKIHFILLFFYNL